MKTREVLLADEKHVVAQLKTMKIKELERHLKKILSQLGQPNYERTMSAVIKAVPQLDSDGDRFRVVRDLIVSDLPKPVSSAAEKAVLERITALIMVLVAKKFTKILEKQS